MCSFIYVPRQLKSQFVEFLDFFNIKITTVTVNEKLQQWQKALVEIEQLVEVELNKVKKEKEKKRINKEKEEEEEKKALLTLQGKHFSLNGDVIVCKNISLTAAEITDQHLIYFTADNKEKFEAEQSFLIYCSCYIHGHLIVINVLPVWLQNDTIPVIRSRKDLLSKLMETPLVKDLIPNFLARQKNKRKNKKQRQLAQNKTLKLLNQLSPGFFRPLAEEQRVPLNKKEQILAQLLGERVTVNGNDEQVTDYYQQYLLELFNQFDWLKLATQAQTVPVKEKAENILYLLINNEEFSHYKQQVIEYLREHPFEVTNE